MGGKSGKHLRGSTTPPQQQASNGEFDNNTVYAHNNNISGTDSRVATSSTHASLNTQTNNDDNSSGRVGIREHKVSDGCTGVNPKSTTTTTTTTISTTTMQSPEVESCRRKRSLQHIAQNIVLEDFERG